MSVKNRIAELLGESNERKIANETIAAAVAKHEEEQAKLVGAEIVNVLRYADDCVQNAVRRLRELRKQEKQARQALEEIARAVTYFHETGDPLPMHKVGVHGVENLVRTTGEDFPQWDSKEFDIPEDWEPSDS